MAQQRLFSEPIGIHIRTGCGSISYRDEDPCRFTDYQGLIWRVPRDHVGWQSVKHNNQRYQLFGGIRTPFFICLNSPI